MLLRLPNNVILSIADTLTRSPGVNHLSQTCHGLYDTLNQSNGSTGLGVPSMICVDYYLRTGEYGDQELILRKALEIKAGEQKYTD
jgi:hypothetical protein